MTQSSCSIGPLLNRARARRICARLRRRFYCSSLRMRCCLGFQRCVDQLPDTNASTCSPLYWSGSLRLMKLCNSTTEEWKSTSERWKRTNKARVGHLPRRRTFDFLPMSRPLLTSTVTRKSRDSDRAILLKIPIGLLGRPARSQTVRSIRKSSRRYTSLSPRLVKSDCIRVLSLAKKHLRKSNEQKRNTLRVSNDVLGRILQAEKRSCPFCSRS